MNLYSPNEKTKLSFEQAGYLAQIESKGIREFCIYQLTLGIEGHSSVIRDLVDASLPFLKELSRDKLSLDDLTTITEEAITEDILAKVVALKDTSEPKEELLRILIRVIILYLKYE